MPKRRLLLAGCALVVALLSAAGLIWLIAARGSYWLTLPEALGLALLSGICVGVAVDVVEEPSSAPGDSAHVGVLIGILAVFAFEVVTMAVWLISQVDLA